MEILILLKKNRKDASYLIIDEMRCTYFLLKIF